MALIKCPECGENVSSSAEKCVHCGVEFSVCPECEQIFLGKPETCNNCGYAFVPQISEIDKTGKHPNPAVQAQLKINNVMGAWRAASPFNTKIDRYSKIAKWSFLIGAIVFLLSAIYLTLNKGQNISSGDYNNFMNSVNDLLNGKSPAASLMSSINALIAFAVIFLILSANSSDIFELYKLLSVGSMIKKYVSDKSRIIEYYKNRTSHKVTTVGSEIDYSGSEMEDIGIVYFGIYLSDVKQATINILIRCGINLLLSLISLVCLGIGLSQNAEAYFTAKIYGNSFEFQYILLIVFAVFCVAFNIYRNTALKSTAKKAVEYCNQLGSDK